MVDGVSAYRHGRKLALACATLTMAVSIVTSVGWITGMPLLASIRTSYIPMAPATALCFSLVGTALLFLFRLPSLHAPPRILASLVIALAFAKFIEVIGGFGFGIDAWFVRDPEMFGKVQTARMAPMSAMLFVLVASAILGMTSRRGPGWVCGLGVATALASAMILVGYLFGTPLLYGGTVIPVALLTACAFFLCGIAIVADAGPQAWPARFFTGLSTRALLLRAFVPVIVVAAISHGWVSTVLMGTLKTNPAVTTAACGILFAVLGTWIISRVSSTVGDRIDSAENRMRAAQDELMALNEVLEHKVAERTLELRTANDQMRQDLKMARELQTALLPRNFPTIPPGAGDDDSAFRFLSLYYPTGDVSGDFFSIFPVGDNAAGVLICDVMGHGVRSALITSMIRGLVEEHAASTADPGELLTRMNHALTLILKQADITMFATCFYVVADVGKARLSFANAGHPPALHIRKADVPVTEKLDGTSRRGPAMGIFPDAKYTTYSKPMTEGDMIMLFTDGLFEVEGSSGESFTEDQLRETVARHAAQDPALFFDSVLQEVRRFSQRETFEDDVCVVGIQVRHLKGKSHKNRELLGVGGPQR